MKHKASFVDLEQCYRVNKLKSGVAFPNFTSLDSFQRAVDRAPAGLHVWKVLDNMVLGTIGWKYAPTGELAAMCSLGNLSKHTN